MEIKFPIQVTFPSIKPVHIPLSKARAGQLVSVVPDLMNKISETSTLCIHPRHVELALLSCKLSTSRHTRRARRDQWILLPSCLVS